MSMSRKIVKQKYGDHFWVKREYDDYGNVTYYEDSIGYWWKREYDDRGNVFCEYQIVCEGCPLYSNFSCGRGVHFLTKEDNGQYSMNNKTIRKAYKTLIKSPAYKKFRNN